ncbi:MAG TPA: hypothetical protein VJ023_09305 [Pyrinomonadaceae bacterium]|nr:hypothetical protein [Pyrinomonadaceae bacterium]
MLQHRTPLLLLVCFLGFSATGFAQESAEKKTPPAKPKAVKAEEADALDAQRRLVAASLLTALADESRSFRDQALRARVGARAADAFWNTDEDKARALFRRAWDEAETADAEAARKYNEEIRRQRQDGGPFAMRRPRDLRSEVLRLVAKRDSKLGEEFLKKLAAADEQAAKEAGDPRLDPSAAPIADAKRLQTARRLLEDGDVERAMQFASPALHSVNRDSVYFLSALREKNAAAADQGFLALLARTERNPAADANIVSGLSSYAFTPFLYVTFSKEGGASMSRERAETPAPDLPPAVRASFFRVAAEILMRPLQAPDQDLTTSGRIGKFMVIKRLLPLFEQYAADYAPVLKTQMTALSTDVPDRLQRENRALTRGILPDDTSRTPLEVMQERLDRARTSEERDGIYADYALDLAGKRDPKAQELLDKIDNAELRKSVQAYIDFQAAQQAINNNEPGEAARIAKSGELTSSQRVWTYTRAARLLLKTDRARAAELLEEAMAEARRIGGNSADRPKCLVGVATVMMEIDRVRGWELVNEALKAANASEGFTGEDSSVVSTLRTRQMVVISNASAADFDLLGLFRSLAKDDLNRSIEIAKGFTAEAPRATATLAIARALLEKGANELTTLE